MENRVTWRAANGEGGSFTSPLECVVNSPATGRVAHVVVALHGYGDSARNFAGLTSRNASQPEPGLLDAGPDTLWVFPQAPFSLPFASEGGGQWYDLFSDPSSAIASSRAALSTLVHNIAESIPGLAPQRIFVLGFSQGGYMALSTVLALGRRLAGVVCLSGYLLGAHRLVKPLPQELRDTPVFLGHGLQDQVVLPHLHFETTDALRWAGFENLRACTYPVGHSLHPAEIREINTFLAEARA